MHEVPAFTCFYKNIRSHKRIILSDCHAYRTGEVICFMSANIVLQTFLKIQGPVCNRHIFELWSLLFTVSILRLPTLQGMSRLHEAAMDGNLRTVRSILQEGKVPMGS